MTDTRNADKYQPGDLIETPRQTDAQVMAEVIDYEGDLAKLILDLRQRRIDAPPGDHRAKLRAVGSALEDAFRDVRKAGHIVRDLKQIELRFANPIVEVPANYVDLVD